MKIAIWGFGPHGQRLFYRILLDGPQFAVTAVFDKNPEGVDRSFLPDGLEVTDVKSLPDFYSEGRFEAVLVGIARAQIREEAEERLRSLGIPVLDKTDTEECLQQNSSGGIRRRELRAGLDRAAACYRQDPVFLKLRDQEARDLFLARVFMERLNDESILLDVIRLYREGKEYDLYELRGPMKRCGSGRVILFGGGKDGALNLHSLNLCGIPVAAVCARDADMQWPQVPETLRISPERLPDKEFADCIIIPSSVEDREEITACLKDLTIGPERIYTPPGSYRMLLTGVQKGQYFDVWEPRDNEVFVDCGAYDGQTIRDFLRWSKGVFRAVYALEPLPKMRERLDRIRADNEGKMTIFSAAAWDREEMLQFSLEQEDYSSSVLDGTTPGETTVTVRGAALDDLIPGPVTFIKMDIEGSERKALDGAERLIRTFRPRLAISVYHRTLDIVCLARRVLEMVPEYRLKVRHYGTGLFETVLYASVEDWE